METIIQQIALELVEKIIKKALEDKNSDLDSLASAVLEDCKHAARNREFDSCISKKPL